jgi:hypothetical protein
MAMLGLDEPAGLVETLVALVHATPAIAVSFTRNVILVARAPGVEGQLHQICKNQMEWHVTGGLLITDATPNGTGSTARRSGIASSPASSAPNSSWSPARRRAGERRWSTPVNSG